MTDRPSDALVMLQAGDIAESPFLRAPERVRAIFLTFMAAAVAPLAAGVVFFGWRALYVTALSVASCAAIERAYYRFTRVPALLGRTHAYLTGLLLGLTLPAYVPWYVPVVAGAFSILVGKAVFGGVGHFLWQPALVGRLAVAVLFASQIATPSESLPSCLPLLAPNKIITGDLTDARSVEHYSEWLGTLAPEGADALLIQPPTAVLDGLSPAKVPEPAFSALNEVPLRTGDSDGSAGHVKPAVLRQLPPIGDMLVGARPGGIGETCVAAIVVAGLYLVYRNYVKWQLPVAFILSACAVAAFAPVQFQGPDGNPIFGWGPPGGWAFQNLLAPLDQWTPPPVLMEGLDVGVIYVCYQLLSAEFLLAAFFLATEMTSRPVTTGGQVLFGIGCGLTAMLLRLYVAVPIPAYMAVLLMNTFSPAIDSLWRPRVFGRRRFAWLNRSER